MNDAWKNWIDEFGDFGDDDDGCGLQDGRILRAIRGLSDGNDLAKSNK